MYLIHTCIQVIWSSSIINALIMFLLDANWREISKNLFLYLWDCIYGIVCVLYLLAIHSSLFNYFNKYQFYSYNLEINSWKIISMLNFSSDLSIWDVGESHRLWETLWGTYFHQRIPQKSHKNPTILKWESHSSIPHSLAKFSRIPQVIPSHINRIKKNIFIYFFIITRQFLDFLLLFFTTIRFHSKSQFLLPDLDLTRKSKTRIISRRDSSRKKIQDQTENKTNSKPQPTGRAIKTQRT